MSRVFGPSSFVLFGCAAAFALSDSVGVSHEDRAHQQKAEPQIPTHYQHALSHEELTIEAAKIGLEVVDPVEWEYHGRGLSSEEDVADQNCEDVLVTTPLGICDGVYYGQERSNPKTLRGPSLFTNTCFSPDDCGDLQRLNRRMFMAKAYRCDEDHTGDCPQEAVWGVYSSITTASGENKLGFLRAWADGALHPADVDTQWWTFQYSSVESADDEKRVCDEADCLLPQDGVTIVCAPGSINRTLPPGGTPYPSPAPTAIGTYVVIPTSAPGGNDAAEGESIGSGDLNGAVGVVPSIWGVGGLRRIAGVILAGCAAWCATSMPLLM